MKMRRGIFCVAMAFAAAGLVAEETKVFGEPMRVKGTLDKMMAVCLDGERLYAGGGTDFYVFDVSSPLKPLTTVSDRLLQKA